MIQKPSMLAAAKEFLSDVYFVGTTNFDKYFLFHGMLTGDISFYRTKCVAKAKTSSKS